MRRTMLVKTCCLSKADDIMQQIFSIKVMHIVQKEGIMHWNSC